MVGTPLTPTRDDAGLPEGPSRVGRVRAPAEDARRLAGDSPRHGVEVGRLRAGEQGSAMPRDMQVKTLARYPLAAQSCAPWGAGDRQHGGPGPARGRGQRRATWMLTSWNGRRSPWATCDGWRYSARALDCPGRGAEPRPPGRNHPSGAGPCGASLRTNGGCHPRPSGTRELECRGDTGQPAVSARPTARGAPVVRVNPAELTVESLHQAPGLAVGPGDEIVSLVGLQQAQTRGDPVCVGSVPLPVREWGPELRAAAADQ